MRRINEYIVKVIKSNIVLRNLFSLSILQVLGMALPLITYPYLIKTTGVDNFGKVNFVLTFLTFAVMIIDFGYSYIAPKEISIHRNEHDVVSKIFSRIIFSKLILLCFVSLALVALIIVTPNIEHKLYLYSAIYLIGASFNLNWFFQGIEKMHFIAIFDSIAKVVATAFVFIIIKNQTDIIYYLPILGIGSLLSCSFGFYYIFKNYSIRFSFPQIKVFLNEYKKGFPIFVGQLSIYFLSSTNILLLGFMSTSYLLGFYVIADKISKVPWSISGLMSTVLFPTVCKQTLNGLPAVWKSMRKYLILLLAFIGVTVLGSIIFREPIIHVFYKFDKALIIPPYIVLMLTVVVITLNIPLNLILLAYSRNKVYMKIFTIIAVVHIILSYFLIKLYNILGASISTFFTYSILLILLYVSYNREKKLNNLRVGNS